MEFLQQDKENLKLVKADGGMPDGYELVEIDDKTKILEPEYTHLIDSLALKAIKDGTIKFTRKIDVDKEKGENKGEKPKEEATLGDFISAMGGLVAALAPTEDAEKIQEGVNQITQLFSALEPNGPQKSVKEDEKGGIKFQKVPITSRGRLATVEEIQSNVQIVEKLLQEWDHWTIALVDGGKLAGRGYGGKLEEGDFTKQVEENIIGEKIIVIESQSNETQEKKESMKANITSQALSDKEEDSVSFTSQEDIGLHLKNGMGSYIKTSQIVKGCPVFEQVNKHEDEKQYYLFVGPDGRWRVGPDVTSYSGSVLKHPKKYAKLPPNNGWLYYLNDKWFQAESLSVTVNVKMERDEEEVVKFSSKGDAEDHRKNRMGSYIKMSTMMIKGCAVFEQVNKQEDEKQYYLFVGPDGRWRVGPDVTSYSGSVLKHPEKNVEFPPTKGWLYYLNEKWNEDDSLQLKTKKDSVGVSQSKAPQKNKIPGSCNCTTAEEYEIKDDYGTKELKNVTCLGIAILRSDTAAVEASLGNECDINFDCIEEGSHIGLTPLILACRWSSLPVVSLLLKHPGIQIDKRNSEGETALAWAVRKPENLDMVKLLVEAGAKVFLRDRHGYSHLHRAVEAGALEIVKYLHPKGANIKTHTKLCTSPLWTAVDEQNLPMVRYLAENGADLDFPVSRQNISCVTHGFNPFHQAVYHGNEAIVKYMIEHGADVTAKNRTKWYWGDTSVDLAQMAMEPVWGQSEDEIEENKQKYGKIISMIKEAEEDSKQDEVVNTCDCSIVEDFQLHDDYPLFHNVSCLGTAVLQDDIESVEASLAKGCNVNFDKTEYDKYGGWTPLMLACLKSSLPVVSLLVRQAGIHLNKVNDKDEAALAWAVRRDENLDMVKFLVEAGADPDMRCEGGFSHLHQAAKVGQFEIVKYLNSKGAFIDTRDYNSTSPLLLAAYDGHLQTVKYLASEGASLDTPKLNIWHEKVAGYFPLNAAVVNAQVDVVKFLIKEGADVDKESEPESRRWGIGMSNLEIARMKLNDRWVGQTREYEEIIGLLKEAGEKEADDEMIKKLVLETMDAIMWIWAEKIDDISKPFPSWDWPNDGELPQCVRKLEMITEQQEGYLAMVQALVEVVPLEHPRGAITIALLIKRTTMIDDPENVDVFLKLLEMASSFEANDRRHGNISVIISCIAGYIAFYKEVWFDIISMFQRILAPHMLAYLFGNLNSGVVPEAATFSLLALEFLAHKKEDDENPNAEIVKNRFSEFSPIDHPLLRLEKLVDSQNLAEKQTGFCAKWYLDNLWTLDNQDVRTPEISDNTNINVRLIPIDKSKCIKVGSNGLELFGNGLWFETAMSTVQVDEGSWYYEVTLVTSGLMQIGWATNQCEFMKEYPYGEKEYAVGDDEFSESYDGCRQVVWYDRLQPKGEEPLGWVKEGKGIIKSWKPGDVVGCFIDIKNEEIVFSLNGVNIRSEPYEDVFSKVGNGFFAAISLMSFQQCQVNFGAEHFKHPPERRTFKPLNEATIKSI